MRTPWLTVLLATLFPLTLPGQDWPAFRGAAGDGISRSKTAPTRWDQDTNVKWRAPLPQPANGSPIVSNGRVFLACAEDEEGRQRSLYCFDRASGKKLWARTAKIDQKMPTHKTNPYCGSTPAANGKRVVVWHASAGLYCYDFAGKEAWYRDLGRFQHRWGYGTSPVLLGDKVILHSGPGQKVFLAAFRLEDGETIWKHEEPVSGDGQDNAEKRLMGSWCTPVITRVAGRETVLCTMSTRLLACDADKGEVLWWCGGLPCKRGDLVYSSPTIAGELCLVLAGYDGPLLGVRLDGKAKGDVTKSHRLYRHQKQPSNCGSGVTIDGHVYLPDMRGFVSCVDPKTGDRLWNERVSKGQIWGSIAYAAGNLYVINQRGITTVFKPNPKKLEVIATNELGEATNATPVICDGEIFLRMHKHLYCIAETRKSVVR